ILLNLFTLGNESAWFWFVRPVIGLSLAVYLYQQVGISSGFNRLVFAALLFSAAGDSLLMIDMENGFSYGLFSFLIAHLCYSLAFYRDFTNDPMASRGYGHLSLFLTGIYS